MVSISDSAVSSNDSPACEEHPCMMMYVFYQL